VTCGCPIAAGDGHDFPRLIDERVPSVALRLAERDASRAASVRRPRHHKSCQRRSRAWTIAPNCDATKPRDSEI